jgi:hypothetical protein
MRRKHLLVSEPISEVRNAAGKERKIEKQGKRPEKEESTNMRLETGHPSDSK